MKYVVADFEMNFIKKEFHGQRSICRMETIEIGAVALDENYMETDSFCTYVKPDFNDVIERKIEKLTGINTEMVKNAPKFNEACAMFFKWCKTLGDDIQFLQWSDSDYNQLTSEIKLKGTTINPEYSFILNPWLDFQKEFNEELGLDKRISLKNALNYAGIDFCGNQHDALYDARNTASLLEIMRKPEKKSITIDKIIDALKPKENVVTLGELFDFSKLSIA